MGSLNINSLVKHIDELRVAMMRGAWGGSEHRNTAKTINEHRITAKKVNETPSPQSATRIFSAMIRSSTVKIILLFFNNFPQKTALTSCRTETQLTYNNRRQKDKRTKKTMETIGLFSGVLLFSALCLLPEVRAKKHITTLFIAHALILLMPVLNHLVFYFLR